MNDIRFMPDNCSAPAQWLELTALFRNAQDEQDAIARLSARIEKMMTDVALEEFPALKNMSATQIREFGDAVSRAGSNFAMRAASLAYSAERERQ